MRWLLAFGLLMACGDDDGGGTDAGVDAADGAVEDAGVDAFDAAFDADLPIERELAENGEFAIGYTTRTVSYERPDGAGTRELELHVWYPAEASDGPRPRYPFRNSEVGTADATPLAGPFPVLVFSHGHQGLPDVSTFLTEHFASHGWLVLSPTHTGNTTPDGPDRVTSIYYLRQHDVSRTLDHMEALDSSDPLAGLVGSPAVVSGHSFGGYTAYAVGGAVYRDMMMEGCAAEELPSGLCSELDVDAEALFAAGFHDDRFDAIIAMASGDGRLFSTDGIAAIDVPVLQMVAEGDGHPAGSADDDTYWTSLDGPSDMRVNLLGGAHQSFTDVCARIPGFLGCPEENDPVEEYDWVKAYALGFARGVLLDDAEAATFLTEGNLDPRVEVTRR